MAKKSKSSTKHEDEPEDDVVEEQTSDVVEEVPAEPTPEQLEATVMPTPAEEIPMPTEDTEFTFEGPDSLPGWVNRSWLGFDRGGTALCVPIQAFDAPAGARQNEYAYPGDTVKFSKAENRCFVEHVEAAKVGIAHAEDGEKYGDKAPA